MYPTDHTRLVTNLLVMLYSQPHNPACPLVALLKALLDIFLTIQAVWLIKQSVQDKEQNDDYLPKGHLKSFKIAGDFTLTGHKWV